MFINGLKWINKRDSKFFNHTKKILKTIIYKFYAIRALQKELVEYDKIYRIVPSLRNLRNIRFITYETTYKYLCKQYLNHRFDLLGSGWVKNSYDSLPLGLEGYKYDNNLYIKDFDRNGKWLKNILHGIHAKKSQKIWELIEEDYSPIDWQKDFKSGYRWSNKSWFKTCNLVIGKIPGVDIKVPWELARFQHLPLLAMYVQTADDREKFLIFNEFKNQILDFISTNPVSFGVNWACTMDVAIRAANILIAYDLFKQVDDARSINDDIEAIITTSMYEHGRFIVYHLEYSPHFTGNHYLSNICGLAFIAAYLEPTTETNLWLVFALQELINEFKKQFYEDGSNFEASTSYHRLSTEMVVFTTALILGLPEDRKKAINVYDPHDWQITPKLMLPEDQEFDLDKPNIFPDWYIERLFKAGCFTADLLKLNNEIPQIGDNDSGRFFKFTPVGDFLSNKEAEEKYLNLKGYQKLGFPHTEMFWDENILDHRPLLAALAGLFDYDEFNNAATDFPLERNIVTSLSNMAKRIKKYKSYHKVKKVSTPNLHLEYTQITNFYPIDIESSKPLNQNLSFHPYPESGIYIFKSDRIHLTVSAGGVGQNGLGGHAHNDKLSIELNIDGEDVALDPGTYLYTPLLDLRNEFRSAKVHNSAIIKGMDQNIIKPNINNIFRIFERCKITLIEMGTSSIKLCSKIENIQYMRNIEIEKKCVRISDCLNVEFYTNFSNKKISNGYGKLKTI